MLSRCNFLTDDVTAYVEDAALKRHSFVFEMTGSQVCVCRIYQCPSLNLHWKVYPAIVFPVTLVHFLKKRFSVDSTEMSPYRISPSHSVLCSANTDTLFSETGLFDVDSISFLWSHLFHRHTSSWARYHDERSWTGYLFFLQRLDCRFCVDLTVI